MKIGSKLLFLSFIFLSTALTSCGTSHLLGYEVYNNTDEPVVVNAIDLALRGRELSPGESAEIAVFIGNGRLKSALIADSLYRSQLENSVLPIDQSKYQSFKLDWKLHRYTLNKGKQTLMISANKDIR